MITQKHPERRENSPPAYICNNISCNSLPRPSQPTVDTHTQYGRESSSALLPAGMVATIIIETRGQNHPIAYLYIQRMYHIPQLRKLEATGKTEKSTKSATNIYIYVDMSIHSSVNATHTWRTCRALAFITLAQFFAKIRPYIHQPHIYGKRAG